MTLLRLLKLEYTIFVYVDVYVETMVIEKSRREIGWSFKNNEICFLFQSTFTVYQLTRQPINENVVIMFDLSCTKL